MFTTLVLQDYSQGYILSYFYKLLRVLSLSRMLVAMTCIFHNVRENFFNLWCSHSSKVHWIYAFLFMSQFPFQNFCQNFLKMCFLQDERGGEKYDLLYQKSIIKFEDDLMNLKMTWWIWIWRWFDEFAYLLISLFIFVMNYNCSKCDVFTVL